MAFLSACLSMYFGFLSFLFNRVHWCYLVTFRLIPRCVNASERKRHFSKVPVKLLRPEVSLRKKNLDRMYPKSFTNNMLLVRKLFDPQAVLFISHDNKGKVTLVLAAATLQAPILVNLEYKVRLPDHNFVVGARHNLISSVCGIWDIIYSGDTFIRIRSDKHDKSSANTHAYDTHELLKFGKAVLKPI